MHHEAVIQAAIDDLNLQLVPNYTTTAKKYGISCHMLSRCYNNLLGLCDRLESISSQLTQPPSHVLMRIYETLFSSQFCSTLV
ncbi:hypothetical protein I7I48_03679 [Histoplasma ohiense]|nr:hypothetical protein I7I48_03679 [Histoplasma ohiense (nom. inval.)]